MSSNITASMTEGELTEEQVVLLALALAKRKIVSWERRWHNDDYCQDVALAALTAWRAGKMNGIQPERYIEGIMKYRAMEEIDALRRTRRAVAVRDDHAPATPIALGRKLRRVWRCCATSPRNPEELCLEKEREVKARALLRRLSPNYRAALNATLAGYQDRQALRLIGCSPVQFRNWKHRGLLELRAMMAS